MGEIWHRTNLGPSIHDLELGGSSPIWRGRFFPNGVAFCSA